MKVVLKEIADVRTGLNLIRKQGKMYEDYHKNYKLITQKAFSAHGGFNRRLSRRFLFR